MNRVCIRWLGALLATGTIGELMFLGVLSAHANPPPGTSAETLPVLSVPGEFLTGSHLARFLGPVSPNLFTWSKSWEPGQVVYFGAATPPLSGRVYITIVLGPREYSQMPSPGGPDRLGVLVGAWQRWTTDDGTHVAEFGFADADNNWVNVNINSPVQADAETIAAEVSRLPIFNSKPEAPFHGLLVRERIIRAVCWLLAPCAFAATIWLADRRVRRTRGSLFPRAITLAAISVLWLGLFIAIVRLSPLGLSGALFWYQTWAQLFWIVAVAAFCFIGAVCVAVGMMLWRLLTARA